MKFLGTGTVWNAETDKPLCKFKKTGIREGYLETQDKKLIEKLKELGYKYEITEADLEEAKKTNKK
jgi:hypothetical protein